MAQTIFSLFPKQGDFFCPRTYFFKRKYSIIKVQKITDSGEKGGKPYGGRNSFK